MSDKYFISFVEEAVMNPRWEGYIGGRIEVTPGNSVTGWAEEEIRFFTKKIDDFNAFRDKYDFKDVDKKTLDMIRSKTDRTFCDLVQ